jgi:hypothetical protein
MAQTFAHRLVKILPSGRRLVRLKGTWKDGEVNKEKVKNYQTHRTRYGADRGG